MSQAADRIDEALRAYRLAESIGETERDLAMRNLRRVVRDVAREQDDTAWQAFLAKHARTA